MNSLLLWIGGLLVAVLGLLFAAPHVIDWNAYRGVLEEEASRILGRDVRVGGKVNLRLLPSPYVRFEKVRISDAGAALGEPFFRAEAFTLWLSPAPLLRGAIEANELELDRPVLRLAVDAEGRGNWQALRITPGALPFVPSDVVLQQVRIKDGVVSLRTPGTPEPLTLTGIEGELAATSLDGPYRFRGMINWYGTARELRIATSQRESDGRLRYKATVRVPTSGNLYAVDGVLSELTARARHSGSMTARLPLASLAGAPASSDAGRRDGRATDAVDIKANIEGDIDGVKLTDLSFAFEQDGKPQLMNGESAASWRTGLRMETRLASRWLDLDNLAGQEGGKAAPVDIVRRLLGQVSALLPPQGNSLLTVDVEQVNLGGEALSGVRLALARAGGLTSIGELKATLPGNAKGELRGTLGSIEPARAPGASDAGPQPAASQARGSTAEAFEGEFVLHGPSYRRFATWAGAGALLQSVGPAGAVDPALRGDAPFSVVSQLRLVPDGMALANANVELGNRQVTAWVDWKWGRERQLEISLEGRSIDIGEFAPGVLDLAATPSQAPTDGAALTATGSAVLHAIAARAAAIDRTVGALRLKLRALELTDGTTTLGDVEADIALQSGRLSIAGLKLGRPGSYRLDLQGELSSISTKPTGALRGWLAAANREGLADVMRALPSGMRASAAHWLDQSRKADLGFSVTLGGRQNDRVSLVADGYLDDARIKVDLRLDGGMARWRDYPVELAISLEGASAADLVRRMAARRSQSAAAVAAPRAPAMDTTFQLKAAGANALSLIGLATLQSGAGSSPARLSKLDFNGRSAVTADGSVELAGNIAFAAADAGDLLLLLGASRRPLVAGTAVRGTATVERKGGTTTLVSQGVDLGTSRAAGRLAFVGKGGRTRIDGEITSSRIAIAGLLGLVLDGEAAAVPTGDGVDSASSPWSEAPINMALLDGLEGQIKISAPAAELSRGLEVSGAELSLALAPGRLTISSLTGAALGGRITVRGTLETAQSSTNVAIEGRLTGAKLDQLTTLPPGIKAGLGEGNITLTLSGRGIGMRSVVSSLAGKGEAEIRNGRVVGLSPALVETAAQAVIESNDEISRAALEKIIATERGRGELVLGNRKLAITVVDGIVKLAALETATPEANIRNVTTVDLTSLKADSEWQIVPRRPLPGARSTARREPLPPLSVVWSAPLVEIARVSPRLSIDQLESDLSIRKMERDTERLEDMRREDEVRAKTEAERLRRLDEAARGPGTGATPPAPVIQAPFPIPPSLRPGPQLQPLPGPPRRQSATDLLPSPTPPATPAPAAASASPPLEPGTAASPSLPPPPRPPVRREAPRTLQEIWPGQQ